MGCDQSDTAVNDISQSYCNFTSGNDTWLVTGHGGQTLIDYCLSDITDAHCEVSMSVYILLVIIICNFVKLCSFLYLISTKLEPLVTIGDAIQSFLADEDLSTRELAIFPFEEARVGYHKMSHDNSKTGKGGERPLISHRPQMDKKWYYSVSGARRYTTLLR